MIPAANASMEQHQLDRPEAGHQAHHPVRPVQRLVRLGDHPPGGTPAMLYTEIDRPCINYQVRSITLAKNRTLLVLERVKPDHHRLVRRRPLSDPLDVPTSPIYVFR